MNRIIEDWWRHLGCYDRQQASGMENNDDAPEYLLKTDEWWNSLDDSQKEEIYTEYFSEN